MMQFIAGVTVLIGLVVFLISTRLIVGRVISPFSVALLVLSAIYGIRPLLMTTSEHFSFYGIDIESGSVSAAVVGLLAVVFLSFGYGLSLAQGGLLKKRKVLDNPSPLALPPQSWALIVSVPLVILGAWVLVTAYYGGGFDYIRRSFDGRSASIAETYQNVPAIIFALPVVACLCLAYSRILYERQSLLSRAQSVGYWVVVVLCLVPPSALGNRRFIIPSLIAAVVGACSHRWNEKISARTISLTILGFIVLAIFPFVRSAGSRTGSSDLVGAMAEYFEREGLRGVLDGFFLSYDTEMFNYVSYVSPRLGESIPFGYGRGTVLEALLVPIPAAIAPFEKWSNILLERAFGATCAELYCPVPSLPGTLLYDLGLPGVVIGMTLVGFTFGRLQSLSIFKLPFTTGLLVLCAIAFTVVIVRGNPVSQLWIALQCFIVAWLALRMQLILINFSNSKRARSALGSRAIGRIRVESAGRG